jgi:hypothetical protein
MHEPLEVQSPPQPKLSLSKTGNMLTDAIASVAEDPTTCILFVCWIALQGDQHLKCYIDDNCSFALLGDVRYYPKYERYFPTDQTKLLELWDELGLPHEERKQIYGPVIPFIGFDVDPNAMTVSLHKSKPSVVPRVA